ncbi:hypothetical protein ACQR07_34385 [Bradyrhizobium sp. HKCCYLS20291]
MKTVGDQPELFDKTRERRDLPHDADGGYGHDKDLFLTTGSPGGPKLQNGLVVSQPTQRQDALKMNKTMSR